MSDFIEQRQVLFQKMVRIEHMEYGSLQAEYRPGTDPDHPLGPYYMVVFLGDGAAWVWEWARVNFPLAVFILDFFHAVEHLEWLAQALFGEQGDPAKPRCERWAKMLKEQADGLDAVLREARLALPRQGKRRQAALDQLAYFENNKDKMRYAEYLARGLFIGSGVVEAGCKTLIGQRLKQSGMFWGVPGAQNVLDLRGLLENRQFALFWEQHREPLSLRPKAA